MIKLRRFALRFTKVLATISMTTGTIAMAKDFRVASDGSGEFKSVQAALDAIAAGNTEPARILIQPGTYEEHLLVPQEKGFIRLTGMGARPDETLLTFHLKASDPKPEGGGNVGTTGSSSVTIAASDFIAENVSFANSAGDKVGQAVAVKTTGDRIAFINCRFTGFQDTLYPAGEGRVYFKNCYVTGNTDFIFGNATAVFDHCTINSSGGGFVTAANTSANREWGFVFLDCTLTCNEGVKQGSVFLGRPWQWDRGPKAAVAFLRTKIGPHINASGWHPWDVGKNKEPGKVSRFFEFESVDLDGKPVDVSARVPWAHQMTKEEAEKVTIEKVLGDWDVNQIAR